MDPTLRVVKLLQHLEIHPSQPASDLFSLPCMPHHGTLHRTLQLPLLAQFHDSAESHPNNHQFEMFLMFYLYLYSQMAQEE